MAEHIYPWKRFVCRRAGAPQLTDGGYLYDPDSQLGAAYNPDVTSLQSLQELPCLVILGEPGIGKTTALRDEWQRRQQDLDATNDFLFVDLGSLQTADVLRDAVFRSTTFQSWRGGGRRLHLFLDGLDECMLRIDTAPTLLRDQLAACPVDRLTLVISCRASDWPPSLEAGLATLWQMPVEPFLVVPLRRKDVSAAASAEGLKPDEFLEAVDRVGAVPLAIYPIPLKFLINTFKKRARLPESSFDLYVQGCEILASEVNPARRERHLLGHLSPRERLAVAARLSALTILANRSVIWTGIDLGDVPEAAIRVSEAEGGIEPFDVGAVDVTEPAIRETLASSLFIASDVNQSSWAHRTYGEFLAANWLYQRKFTLAQIVDVLAQSADGSGQVIPQLAPVAAWLAGINHHWFSYVLQKDPELLLETDASSLSDLDKWALVVAILKQEPAEALARALDLRRGYWKLAHPTLIEQLRPPIRDPETDIQVRRVAIDIAAACRLSDLQHDLIKIALDSDAPLSVRIDAVQAIRDIGAQATKATLKQLAMGPLAEDPDDELKGSLLFTLWPGQISVKEVLDHLGPPKSELFGLYWLFLTNGFAPRLQIADLPVALRWAAMQPPFHGLPTAYTRLIGSVFERAWQQLEHDAVRAAFGEAARARLQHHEDITADDRTFQTAIKTEDSRRRFALSAIVGTSADPQETIRQLLTTTGQFFQGSDVRWLLDQAETSQPALRAAWLEVIDIVFYDGDREAIDAVWQACEDRQDIRQKLEYKFAIPLNSPAAQYLRKT